MRQEHLLNVIRSTHVSEKASIQSEKHSVYVLEVLSCATKRDVKQAVELLFKTKVDCVRIVNVKTKPKRFGSIQGHSKAWKKAYVTLEKGAQVDFATGVQ